MKDLLLDIDGDIDIAGGDLVVGECDEQNQLLMLQANKGDYKENPTIGVGVTNWLKDENPANLLAEIKKEAERDGMTVREVKFTDEGKIYLDASY